MASNLPCPGVVHGAGDLSITIDPAVKPDDIGTPQTIMIDDEENVVEETFQIKRSGSFLQQTVTASQNHRRFKTISTFNNNEHGDHEVTGISRLEVFDKTAFSKYLARFGEVNRAAPGYLGRDVIEPQNGGSVYVVVLRFKDVRCLNAWKNSEARRAVIRDGEEKKVFRVVALDVEEGASLTVVEQDKFQRGQSFSAPPPPRTEPSKWKVAITIYLAVLSVSLPVNLYLRPLLLSSGLSKLEAFFTGACIISIGMVYFTSPLVSYLARPFLRPWPTKLFDRLTQHEPFKSLEVGLPCLRPEPPAYVALLNTIRADVSSLEALINETEHRGHMQRWRLQERVELIEDSLLQLMEAAEQSPTIADPVGMHRAGQVIRRLSHEETNCVPLPSTTPGPLDGQLQVQVQVEVAGGELEKDKLWAAAEGEKQRLEGSGGPVTVVIHERVRSGLLPEFIEHVHRLASLAKRFRGFLGCSLIKPGRSTGAGDAGDSSEVTVILKFESYALLHDFLGSEQRRRWLVRLQDLVEEEEGSVDVQAAGPGDVVSCIFSHPTAGVVGGGPGAVAPVQKWKMVVLIFIALGSMGYVIPVLWIMPIYHHTLGYVSALLFATSLSVTCTVFVTIPLLLMLLRRWVFAPWTESSSAFVRVLQKGFPCWA